VASDRSSAEIQELIAKRKGELHNYVIENFSDALSGLKLHEDVDIGIPAEKIVEKAATEGVDMIVISTHGRSGLRRLVIGSVTEKVVRLAACPVLSLRPFAEDASRDKVGAEKAAD
jgi:nucleotide-binding universal stress UspA family protein